MNDTKPQATNEAAGAASALDDVLSAAGVKVGQSVIWRWHMPLLGMSEPKRMTVVGEHKNDAGVPAVEVQDERGMKFRAYPGELFAADNGEVRGASRLAGEASASTVVLEGKEDA